MLSLVLVLYIFPQIVFLVIFLGIKIKYHCCNILHITIQMIGLHLGKECNYVLEEGEHPNRDLGIRVTALKQFTTRERVKINNFVSNC